jgi:hypothetical protein
MMKKILLLVWCIGIFAPVIAQEAVADTAFVDAAAASAKKVFYQSKAIQLHLYNGVSYLEPRLTNIDEFPYFMLNDWATGSVAYDGEQYDNVGLIYDIFNDDLITELPSSGAKIKLVKEKISAFTIFDVHFVKLQDPAPKPGFYALLYNGPTKVYGRFEKKRQERIEANAVQVEYEKRTRYYILKNGSFHSVKSKGDVYKLFSDKKRELKQLAQKNNLQFNKNKEQSIIKLATFYDTIQP